MVINELLVKLGFEADETPLKAVNEHLESISHKLSWLAAAEVVKGLYELAERFSGVGEQLETAAVSAGITAEAFQKLAFAGSQNAVSQEELSGSLAKLNRNLYEAKKGGDQAVAAFAEVGITPEQIASFTNSSDALRALSDRFVNIKDPIQRQAAAMQLLGRGSYNMVKFLGQGSKAIDQLGNSAEAMGAVVTNDQVEALAKLEDTISGLGQIFKSLGASIAAKVAPSITFLIHKFEEFYAANRQIIAVNFDDWIYDITYGMGYFAGVLSDVTGILFSFIGAHPVLVSNIGKVAIALGALSIFTEIALGSIGFLAKGFNNVVGVLKLLPSGFDLLKNTGGNALSLVVQGLALFKSNLGKIAFRLGVMLAGVFPGLSAFLISVNSALIASPIGLFAAGLLAVILAGQALWTLLHGGSLKDTWIGMLFDKVLALPSAIMRVYRYLKGEKDPVEVLRGDGSGSLLTRPSNEDDFASQLDIVGLTAQMQALLGNSGAAFGAASNMAAASMSMPVAFPLFNMMDDAKNSGGYTLNAPVTINTADALSPTEAYKAVKEAASDHFDRQVRDLMRSQQTAVVH